VGAAAGVATGEAGTIRAAGARVRAWLTPDRSDPTQVVLRRAVAYLLDALLIALILVVVIWITGDVQRSSHGCPDPIPKGRSCLGQGDQALIVNNDVFFWFFLSLVVLFVLVFAVIPGITGASPGKSLLKLRVVRPDGTKPGWKRGLVRSACWGVDALALVLPVGLWLAMLTPRHRRLGDYVARTYVVRQDAAGRPVPLRRSPTRRPPPTVD
jgi:uncharacterized RDD family membrane protein YckC